MNSQLLAYQPVVKILADSSHTQSGERLTTVEISNFPKNLLAELNTHRVFSRNAASSRAIPVTKIIDKIKSEPYIPTFTANQRGMVGKKIDEEQKLAAQAVYLVARDKAITEAEKLIALGIHKEFINRLLEPWLTVPVLITSNTWANFLKLRCSEDASPDLRAVALEIRRLLAFSTPVVLDLGQVHAPFAEDWQTLVNDPQWADHVEKIVAARCARISYINHGLAVRDLKLDKELGERLILEGHLSPFEHIAYPIKRGSRQCRNFNNFYSARAKIEDKRVAVL